MEELKLVATSSEYCVIYSVLGFNEYLKLPIKVFLRIF